MYQSKRNDTIPKNCAFISKVISGGIQVHRRSATSTRNEQSNKWLKDTGKEVTDDG